MSEPRIVDVGAGTDPDPRADATADLHAEADYQIDLEAEWPWDDGALEGIIAKHVVEHLDDPEHFMAEAARCLQCDGWLEVTVPVGQDALADPDHSQLWTWRTPAIYCRLRSELNERAWDPDPPLRLVTRGASVWFYRPLRVFTPVLQAASAVWPAEAVRRCSSGEITARYRRLVR